MILDNKDSTSDLGGPQDQIRKKGLSQKPPGKDFPPALQPQAAFLHALTDPGHINTLPQLPYSPPPELPRSVRPVAHARRQQTFERAKDEKRENLHLKEESIREQQRSRRKDTRRTMSESPVLQSHDQLAAILSLTGVPGSFPNLESLRHDTDPKGQNLARGYGYNSRNNNEDDHGSQSWEITGSHGYTPSDYSGQIAPDMESQSDIFNDPTFWEELAQKFNLCLSMQFRDGSDREKFFVTYIEKPNQWRKVTVSCDYRKAPENSLELTLKSLRYQRDKIARIYEAIRDSLDEIQFYDSVTNLKLETTGKRLHVHVAEDVNEITQFPALTSIAHLDFTRHNNIIVPEADVIFVAHLSGFVYQVDVGDHRCIKKEISTPDTVQEFLYEINALAALRGSASVIGLIGVVVDETSTVIKGLLIEYASGGSIADFIFENNTRIIPWERKEKWARQVVSGIADIHAAGFVQGDCTISNVVLDRKDNIKIVDINRRGCPIGWEPPEFEGYIRSGLKLFLYIGVKSDLYQLGMILWAIAKQSEEPERQDPPLRLEGDEFPSYFREIVHTCLSAKPEDRKAASVLLSMFPEDVAAKPDSGRPLSPLSAADMEDIRDRQRIHARHRRARESATASSRPNSTAFQFEELNQQETLLAGIDPFTGPNLPMQDEAAFYFPPPVHQDSGFSLEPAQVDDGEEDVIAGIHEQHRREHELRQLHMGSGPSEHPKRTFDMAHGRSPPMHNDSGFGELQFPNVPTSAGFSPHFKDDLKSHPPEPGSNLDPAAPGPSSSNALDSTTYVDGTSSRNVEMRDEAPEPSSSQLHPQPQNSHPENANGNAPL